MSNPAGGPGSPGTDDQASTAAGGPQPADYDPDDEIDFAPPPTTWAFRAMPDPFSPHEIGVYDGDTYDLLINQEFYTHRRDQLRAVHIDTAEISGHRTPKGSPEYKAGIEQRDFARDWMRAAQERCDDRWCLVLRTRLERGKYDRLLGEVFDTEGNSLERALIDEFGGTPYFRWGDLY